MPKSKRVPLCGSEGTKHAFVSAFPTVEHFLTSDEHALDNRGLSHEEQDLVQRAPLQYLREEVLPDIVSGLDLFQRDVLISTGCEYDVKDLGTAYWVSRVGSKCTLRCDGLVVLFQIKCRTRTQCITSLLSYWNIAKEENPKVLSVIPKTA